MGEFLLLDKTGFLQKDLKLEVNKDKSMSMKHRVNIADLPFVLSFDAFPNSLIDKALTTV